jgi:hypothetical protein
MNVSLNTMRGHTAGTVVISVPLVGSEGSLKRRTFAQRFVLKSCYANRFTTHALSC